MNLQKQGGVTCQDRVRLCSEADQSKNTRWIRDDPATPLSDATTDSPESSRNLAVTGYGYDH
jgi:hypothetical protein